MWTVLTTVAVGLVVLALAVACWRSRPTRVYRIPSVHLGLHHARKSGAWWDRERS